MSTSASCASGSAGGAVTGTPAAAKALTVALPGGAGAGEGRSSDVGSADAGAKVCGPLTPTMPVNPTYRCGTPLSPRRPLPLWERRVHLCLGVHAMLGLRGERNGPVAGWGLLLHTPLFTMPMFSAHWTFMAPSP
jgi:hypothetical protein